MGVEQMRAALTGLRFSPEYPAAFTAALNGTRPVLALINLSGHGTLSTLDPCEPVIPPDWEVGLWINLTGAFLRLRPYFLTDG